jgi:hypothetical protein
MSKHNIAALGICSFGRYVREPWSSEAFDQWWIKLVGTRKLGIDIYHWSARPGNLRGSFTISDVNVKCEWIWITDPSAPE